MKKHVIILTLVGICLSLSDIQAQVYEAPEVIVSTEKVSVGGYIYYAHTVGQKQTVFSICKAYGITAEQLEEANPALKTEGLKAGAILMIPTGQKALSAPAVQDEEFEEDEASAAEENTADEVVNHRVKWYESIKIISARYGIPAEDILEYNNISSINKGMVLSIPMRIYKPGGTKADISETGRTGLPEAVSAEDTSDEEVLSVPDYQASSPLKMTMILPLNASSLEPSANYFDFYCGALMALEECKKEGKFIEMNIYDLAAYRTAGEITGLDAFRSSDVIIGPADAQAMEPFVAAAEDFHIPFVSPMDQKAEKYIGDNEYFFQVPASAEVQIDNMINRLNYSAGDKVFLFYNSAMSEADYVNSLKSILDAHGVPYKEVSYGILDGRTIVESIRSSLSLTGRNKVIVASEVEAFASDVVRNMKVLSLSNEKYPIEVYCSNRLRNFDTIDTESFYEVSAHISAPYYVDYLDTETKDFIFRYRAMFNAEPTPYSYQGHDIVSYFVKALHSFGKDFVRHADKFPAKLLQCNIRFEQEAEGSGWYNAATRDIVYDSETLEIILSDGKGQD